MCPNKYTLHTNDIRAKVRKLKFIHVDMVDLAARPELKHLYTGRTGYIILHLGVGGMLSLPCPG